MTIEETYKKFFQGRVYLEELPPKELIESLLKKTYELVPSKQSIMPYKVTVYGPELKKLKLDFQKFCAYHWDAEKQGTFHSGVLQLDCPYLLIFTERGDITDYNPFVRRKIAEGDPYFVLLKGSDLNQKHIEVGMFCKILTGLCLENNLCVSYTLNLPRIDVLYPKNKKLWPLKGSKWEHLECFYKDNLLFAMSIGYSKYKESLKWKDDIKPPIENIIKWK
jgi:hypothetical protein